MWDGIDCHRCRINGWIACSWDDPEIRFIHLRPMGSSQQNILVGRMRWGFGQYFMGTGPVYMAASAVFRMKKRPFIIGGLCMMWGYVRSWLRRDQDMTMNHSGSSCVDTSGDVWCTARRRLWK